MKYLKTALLAVLLVVASPAGAQEVQKSVHAVGEWCEYVNMYGNVSRHTVIEAALDGSHTIKITGELLGSGLFRTYNAEQEFVKSSGEEFTPARKSVAFPLRPGNTSGGGEFENVRTGTKGVTTILRSVTEQVTVPAGTFEAVRVDDRTEYTRKDGIKSTVDRSQWYAVNPKIKRYVKFESINYRRGQRRGRALYEMRACGVEDVSIVAEALK